MRLAGGLWKVDAGLQSLYGIWDNDATVEAQCVHRLQLNLEVRKSYSRNTSASRQSSASAVAKLPRYAMSAAQLPSWTAVIQRPLSANAGLHHGLEDGSHLVLQDKTAIADAASVVDKLKQQLLSHEACIVQLRRDSSEKDAALSAAHSSGTQLLVWAPPGTSCRHITCCAQHLSMS